MMATKNTRLAVSYTVGHWAGRTMNDDLVLDGTGRPLILLVFWAQDRDMNSRR